MQINDIRDLTRSEQVHIAVNMFKFIQTNRLANSHYRRRNYQEAKNQFKISDSTKIKQQNALKKFLCRRCHRKLCRNKSDKQKCTDKKHYASCEVKKMNVPQ